METLFCDSLFNFYKLISDEEACIEYLEKRIWPNGVISPYDPTSKVYNYGNHQYRCKNTGKDFNVRTKTIFNNTKLPLGKWFLAIWLNASNKKGITSVLLAKHLGVSQPTAWKMLHSIRKCYGRQNQGKLSNEVELDETFVGGKNKNRHRDKKVKNSQGRSFKDKIPVFGMLERGGKLICRVVKNTSEKELTIEILKHIKKGTILFTDEWCGYNRVGQIYERRIVDHGHGQYVDGDAYTNNIEGFWGIFKKGIFGVYNHVSKKHLQRYVNEFVFRYNTRQMSDGERFNLLLCNSDQRLTYKELIYG